MLRGRGWDPPSPRLHLLRAHQIFSLGVLRCGFPVKLWQRSLQILLAGLLLLEVLPSSC
jgi:hypothetical protein